MPHSKADLLNGHHYHTHPLLLSVFDRQLSLCIKVIRSLLAKRGTSMVQVWVVFIHPNGRSRVVAHSKGNSVTVSCAAGGAKFPGMPARTHKIHLRWPDESGRTVGELHFATEPKLSETALFEVKGLLAGILYSLESTMLVVALREDLDDARGKVASREAVRAMLEQLMNTAVRFLGAVAGGGPVLMAHFDLESWRNAKGTGGIVVSTPTRERSQLDPFLHCLTACVADWYESRKGRRISAHGERLGVKYSEKIQACLKQMSFPEKSNPRLDATIFPIHRPRWIEKAKGLPYLAVVSFCASGSEPVLREATRIFLREFYHLVLDEDELYNAHKLEALLQGLTRIASLTDIADGVLKYLKASFQATEVAVLQRRGDYLSIVRAVDVPQQDLPPLRIDDPKPQVCRVARNQELHYSPNVFLEEYLPVVEETRSQFTIPLIQGTDVVGVLLIGLGVYDGLPPQHQKVVQAAASHCARAIAVTQRIVEERAVRRITADVLRRAVAALTPVPSPAAPSPTIPDKGLAVAQLLESMLRYLVDAEEAEFAGKYARRHSPEDLNQIVKDYVNGPMWSSLRPNSLRFEPSRKPLLVSADAESLTRAIHELVCNAFESIVDQQDGSIHLRCSRETRHVGGRPVGCAILEVEDTGSGCELGAEAHLFQPGYSTKQGHLGLGLPRALSTVRSFGGDIETPKPDSSRHQPNVFRLWLPLRPHNSSGSTGNR